MAQRARNLCIYWHEQNATATDFIHDADTKFTAQFDAILESEGVRVHRLPPCSPTRKDRARAGTSMPQFSLADYFAAMRAVMTGCVEGVPAQESLLPIRRFNPASLTTYAGCSVFAQLMKSARAIIIEDVDVMPNDLLQHKERFGLEGTAAIYLKGGEFATVAQQYVVGNPAAITRLQGQRLW